MTVTERAPAPLAVLTEDVQVIAYEPGTEEGIRILARVAVDPGNPAFAGHYPGLPVFPGVCQIDCVHRTVLFAARMEGVTPTVSTVSTARFLRMVVPRDEIRIEALISGIGEGWKVTAVLRVGGGPVARVGLRYRLRSPS